MIELKYIIINDEPAGKEIAPHFHSGYELTYYVTGKGYCEYQEKPMNFPLFNDKRERYIPFFEEGIPKTRLNFSAGDCIIFPPNIVHYKKHTENSCFLSLVFSLSDPSFAPRNICYTASDSYTLSFLLNRAVDEYKKKSTHYVKMLECLLTEIFIELNRNNRLVNNNIDDFIKQSVSYINDYFLSEIDFRHYCFSNGYSIDYFRHKFKEFTSLSPKAYLLRKRIEYAAILLKSTTLTVNRIAEMCQFGDYAQFSTYFSKKYSLSPTQYRKSCQK